MKPYYMNSGRLKIYKNISFAYRQRSVCGRCPVPGDHPSQAAWRWVSTWMGDCRSAACTSKTLSGRSFFQNCRLRTDSVKWPTVSAQVLHSFSVPSCKCGSALGENSCGHILKGRGELLAGRKRKTGEKVRKEERGKRRLGYV